MVVGLERFTTQQIEIPDENLIPHCTVEKRILALPTWSQKCLDPELQLHTPLPSYNRR